MLFVFADPIIRIYELEEHITANAIQYLRIVSTGLPFVFLSAAFTGIYNAAGRSKIPFFISGTGLVLNIILDPLLIFGLGLGINGAAYATWIAEASVFLIFVYQLRHRDALLGGFSFFTRLKKQYTRRILKLGLPVATLNTLFAFVNMFLCRTASEQGGHIGIDDFYDREENRSYHLEYLTGILYRIKYFYRPKLCSRTDRTGTQGLAYYTMDDWYLRNILHIIICFLRK